MVVVDVLPVEGYTLVLVVCSKPTELACSGVGVAALIVLDEASVGPVELASGGRVEVVVVVVDDDAVVAVDVGAGAGVLLGAASTGFA